MAPLRIPDVPILELFTLLSRHTACSWVTQSSSLLTPDSATPIPKSRTDLSDVVRHRLGELAQLHLLPQHRPTPSSKSSPKMQHLTGIPRLHRSPVVRRFKASACRVLHPRLLYRRLRQWQPRNSTRPQRSQVARHIQHRLQQHQICSYTARQHRPTSLSIGNCPRPRTSP